MQDRNLQELLLRILIELLINLLNSAKKVVEWQWMLLLASYYFFFLGFLKEKTVVLTGISVNAKRTMER